MRFLHFLSCSSDPAPRIIPRRCQDDTSMFQPIQGRAPGAPGAAGCCGWCLGSCSPSFFPPKSDIFPVDGGLPPEVVYQNASRLRNHEAWDQEPEGDLHGFIPLAHTRSRTQLGLLRRLGHIAAVRLRQVGGSVGVSVELGSGELGTAGRGVVC